MSSGETDYTFRTPGPDYLVRARAQRAKLPIYRDGALVEPTVPGSTFKLFDIGDDIDTATPLVSGAVDNVGSIPGRSILASEVPSTLEYGRGYLELWHFVLPDGSERDIPRPAALCRSPLYPVISDIDVDPRGELARHRATTVTSFQSWIDSGWLTLLGMLEEVGRWPEKVWTPYAFRALHMHLTNAEIYASYARSQGGKWLELKADAEKQASFAWTRLRAMLDNDQDGQPDSEALVGMEHGTIFGSYTPYRNYSFGGLS